MTSEARNCQNCKQEFRIESDDFRFYERMQVPAPTFCPQCRLQRRLMFRNERSLYKRNCDLCGQSIISMYSKKSPFPVYCPSCFHSDKWDPLSYGREYDFSKPFFVQFRELRDRVPHLSLLQENAVNSPWTNYEANIKNCYLTVGGHENEDCAYNQYVLKSRDTFDNFWLMSSQFCYESVLSENCYKTFYSKLCFDCRDTYFSFDCRNCSNVFGCSGLRHKQYYIFNKPVSKEEFESFMQKISLSSYEKNKEAGKKAEDFFKSVPQRASFIDKSVNSTGNLIKESKNCQYCWSAEKCEDVKFGFFDLELKDSMDATSIWKTELAYESMGGITSSNIKFSVGFLDECRNLEYCNLTFNCQDCFGCLNMRAKSYCILNKQYSKEEYDVLAQKIRKHMNDVPFDDEKGRSWKYGEFFPYALSPFSYMETVANEYFPLTGERVKELSFKEGEYVGGEGHRFSDYAIPDDIKEVTDDILEKVLKCEVSGKAYKLIPMELAFYRRLSLPIPRVSPFERHRKRLQFIANHINLLERACGKCGKKIESVYGKEEFPIVYCEQCYQAEVI